MKVIKDAGMKARANLNKNKLVYLKMLNTNHLIPIENIKADTIPLAVP